MGALLLVVSACSSTPPYPDAITFNQESLTKAASWTKGPISAIVYVRHGEKMPNASLQVGVLVSNEHSTSKQLQTWISERGGMRYHRSGTPEESCTVGENAGRTYMSLVVCKTGVNRAACVEADEELNEQTFTTCLNSGSCFDEVCDARWLDQREALDLLAADMLSIR